MHDVVQICDLRFEIRGKCAPKPRVAVPQVPQRLINGDSEGLGQMSQISQNEKNLNIYHQGQRSRGAARDLAASS